MYNMAQVGGCILNLCTTVLAGDLEEMFYMTLFNAHLMAWFGDICDRNCRQDM